MMTPVLPLPRLLFGAGALSGIASELVWVGVRRPLLLSDRGLERVGAVDTVARMLPIGTMLHLDVPENPTVAGADAAFAAYRTGDCDGLVALGGGSVLDTAKFVAAQAAGTPRRAIELIGKPEVIGQCVAPLIAIPTTVGTGSESSPVAALHLHSNGPPIGTRSPLLVPRVAICDPDLARTLPPRLIAATGIDALAHCLEGYFAEPANPIVDALALDGLSRAYANIRLAAAPGGNSPALEALMAAAFAGGAAIHKGLGPAHAIALVFGDQELHHGTLIAAALPLTVPLVAANAVMKAQRVAAAMGLRDASDIGGALLALVRELGLPLNLRVAGYKATYSKQMADDLLACHFNRTSPYVPTRGEYTEISQRLLS